MTKVLITGMTAQQANPASHRRALNFTGLLCDQLMAQGHQVDWRNPEISDKARELHRYDKVFVGIAPLTALGANRSYCALSTIDRLWDDPRLVLVVDAPEPAKISNSIEAISRHPHNLTKPFFSYRKAYTEAVKESDRLLTVVQRLREETWPTTIFPILPWQDESRLSGNLPAGAQGQIIPLNLDQVLIQRLKERPEPMTGPRRNKAWAIERGNNPRWLRQQQIHWGVRDVPRSNRRDADAETMSILHESEACLITPDRDGLWWNTRFMQAPVSGTPVATAWQETRKVEGWDVLPAGIEHSTPEDRRELAAQQLSLYMKALDNDTTIDQVAAVTEKVTV